MIRGTLLSLLMAAAMSGDATAQGGLRAWVGVLGGLSRARGTTASGVVATNGLILGGEGGVAWGPVCVRGAYAQGSLGTTDQVQGSATLGIRVLGRLEVETGPMVRSFVTSDTWRRWVFWQVRTRYEAAVVPSVVWGVAELWGAVAGDVNAAGAFGRALGGSAGIVVRVHDSPLALQAVYSIDEARLQGNAARQTVEGVTIGVRYGRP